jgi:hypothetical protein
MPRRRRRLAQNHFMDKRSGFVFHASQACEGSASIMALQIAERWFEEKHIGDGITLLWEPHVIPLMRCNIWHVRGRDRDLIIDSGMGSPACMTRPGT